MPQTTITDIGAVGIPVSDQEKAVEFFTGTLGFEKRLDARIGESFRWVTVAAPGASTTVALIASPDIGSDTGIRFLVPDAETEHTGMRQRGIEVSDLLLARRAAHVRVQGPRRQQVRDRRATQVTGQSTARQHFRQHADRTPLSVPVMLRPQTRSDRQHSRTSVQGARESLAVEDTSAGPPWRPQQNWAGSFAFRLDRQGMNRLTGVRCCMAAACKRSV